MSVDLNALATWTYEDFTITHVASQQSVVIDVAANFSLHQILSDPHWDTIDRDVYSTNPDDWLERSIRWNRAQENPPVLGVEQNIGAADYVDYTVIELEDDASFGPILDDIATILQDGHTNGFAPAHARMLLKNVAKALQLGGLIG